MPDCEYFENLCSANLDGELSRAQKRELDAHLAECPACAAYMEDLRLMRTAWSDLKEPLPEALHEQIMQKVMEEARANAPAPEKKTRRRPPVFTMIGAAAACVLLVLSGAVGDLLGETSGDPTEESTAPQAANGAAMEDTRLTGASSETVDTPEPEESAQGDASAAPRSSAESGKTKTAAPHDRQESTANAVSPQSGEVLLPEKEGGAGLPAVMAMDDPTENPAAELAVTIPDELQAYSFGFCYVAVGSGDPPALDKASLIEKDGSTYYFKAENNLSTMERISAQLQEAGYQTAMRSDIGITTDDSAAYNLLIVSVGSQ